MSRVRFIALLLALITLVVYLPVGWHQFVNYDYPDYVTDNPFVKNGLSWTDFKWAFTTFHASNWHPLTWLSLMVDAELFGLDPSAFHFVNVLFHAANTILLFILLLRLMDPNPNQNSNSFWPCALVAALFAWHPLHVESVAWIAERKDVLSAFFGLLALLSYTNYAQKRVQNEQLLKTKSGLALPAFDSAFPLRDYLLALIFFTLSLLAKPMLVTLPCVLLLLDFWPLKRFANSKFSTAVRLAWEKWPFFLLTIALCVVTCLAQRGAEASLEKITPALRLENSLVAYAAYLFKIFWPVHLAFFYPLVAPTFGKLLASILALAAISIAAWRRRKSKPYFLFGWLWFLGTLVPVIGWVQVGEQAMADRYTYLPAIGIFVIVIFGAADFFVRIQMPKLVAVGIATLILLACISATEHQLQFWRDDESLFKHAVAVTKNNETAHLNLGVVYEKAGRDAEALTEYRAALKINPRRARTYNNLGDLLDKSGQPEKALAAYQESLRLNPEESLTHVNLGLLFVELGRLPDALTQFQTAIQLAPDTALPHYQMGKALLKQGRDAAAIDQLRQALRLEPDNFPILTFTARVLAADENATARDGKTALELAARANDLTGGQQPLVLDTLGMAYAENGDFTNAQKTVQAAIKIAAEAQMKNLAELQQRLELYQNHQPWRKSFLTTNIVKKSNE